MTALTVRPISKAVAEKIVKAKHYSRRLGIFWEGFGLYDGDVIVGVCCFGQPSAPIQKHAFKDRKFRLYELTRLVVDRGIKNGASILIGGGLRMLSESPAAVVSYADTAHGHSGIVYQATNWIYTGATKAHDSLYLVNGERLHPMTVRDRFGIDDPVRWARENRIERVPPDLKHRYFFLLGTKRQKVSMLRALRYDVVKVYPKSEKSVYDDGPRCSEVVS